MTHTSARSSFVFAALALAAAVPLAAHSAPSDPIGVDSLSPAQMGELFAGLATTQEQARLWRQAAADGSFDNVPKDLAGALFNADAVVRWTPLVIDDAPVETAPIPKDAVHDVRLIGKQSLSSGPAEVRAKVIEQKGDRVVFSTDKGEQLTLDARLYSLPLPVAAGDDIGLVWDVPSSGDRREVLAVRGPGGAALYAVVGAEQPATLALPAWGFSAQQLAPAQDGSLSVEVTIDGQTATLAMGQTARLGAAPFDVTVLSSVVSDETPGLRDGPAYALRLVARTVQP
jgi:hypothetical protein